MVAHDQWHAKGLTADMPEAALEEGRSQLMHRVIVWMAGDACTATFRCRLHTILIVGNQVLCGVA